MTENEGSALDAESRLEQAASWFLRARSESARAEDLPELQRWMQADRRNAEAYRQIAATWSGLGEHASAPEIVVGRRDALDHAHQAARDRWSVRQGYPWRALLAACVLLVVGAVVAWTSLHRGLYETELGERRTLTLPDGSGVTLDARSAIRVAYTDTERVIVLERGRARFDVAKDPARPFRVKARDQTVVAVGTQFNVEIVGGGVLVTMIEGRVAVTGVDMPQPAIAASEPTLASHAARNPPILELEAGEGLSIRRDGRATLIPSIDVARSGAWQSGRLIFDNEPLVTAAERVNRYAPEQIEVDESVAHIGINGVFNSGDSHAFIEAVTDYFPVTVQRIDDSRVRLSARR